MGSGRCQHRRQLLPISQLASNAEGIGTSARGYNKSISHASTNVDLYRADMSRAQCLSHGRHHAEVQKKVGNQLLIIF